MNHATLANEPETDGPSTDGASTKEPARITAPARITGAGAVVQTLEALGVELVFGYPGGAIMPIYDALQTHSNYIRHVLVRHEQGAVHAAQGYARTSGKAAVCMATSGPGATNFITGLADAMLDSTPVIGITGQVPSALRGTDAFQEADIIGMTLSCTKWNCQVSDPADIPQALRTAFKVAHSGRPGPVLIDITKDAQFATLLEDGEHHTAHYGEWQYGLQYQDLSGINKAAELINEAQRPLLLVGQGVLLAGAQREARLLAERAQLPTAATLLGLSAIPTHHPQYVGLLGMHGNYAPNILTNEADVIVAIGMRFDDRVTGRVERYAPHAHIVHIDIDPAEINKIVRAEIGIVADAKIALTALLPHIEAHDRSAWLGRFRAHEHEEMTTVITPALYPPAGSLHMGEVIRRVSEQTDGRAIIVSDVGQHQMFAARHYQFREPNSHITSGGLGTMGFALPAAIGACIGSAQRQRTAPVVAIIGDGGFQMTLQELGTIMQEQLAVKIIIMNNGYLGMVRQWQELFFDRRYSQVHMENPDFVTLCAGFHIPAERVNSRDQIDSALQRLLELNGPGLLEVVVGREDNVFPMIPSGLAVDEIRLS